MAHFSALPLELITHILYKTSPNDLLTCKRINKYFYNLIQSSILLQYHLALDGAQAENNPYSSLPSSLRLKELKDSESAWAFLRPKLTATIPVPHNPSGIYDLTGGIYLLGNANRTQLHYLKLPSSGKDAIHWEVINVGRTIIDMGLCVYEHDLIAIITTTPRLDTPRTFDIELSILKFSTGQPHPEARESKIHVLNSQWEKPAIGIEIVGDHLVLVVYYSNAFDPEDHVFIWEWRTGVLKTHFTAPYRTYSGLIFLTEHLILLPNTQKNSLDIFRIPSTSSSAPTSTTPLLSLLLPALANGRALGAISCRAEPNPISQSSLQSYFERKQRTGGEEDDLLKPTRGFLADAEEAICIFTIRVLGVQLGNFQFGHTFTFIVHRHALVNIVEEFEREQGEEILNSQTLETPTIDLEQVDGIVNVEHLFPAAPVTESVDEDAHLPRPAPAPTPIPIKPYQRWGPMITRWFNADGIPTRWITTTAGQRYVLIAEAEPESALGPGYPYVVLDFGKVAIQRMLGWTEAINERVAKMARQGKMVVVEEPHEDRLEGVLSASEEDEGTLSLMDLGVDEWAFEHLDTDDSEEGSDNMSLEHDGSPTGSDLEVDGEAERFGFVHDFTPSVDVEMAPNRTPDNSETQGQGSEFPNSLDEDEAFNLSKRIWCMTKPNVVEPADTFAEPVWGSLPYVACASERPHPFHGALLDEERIVGLRTDMLDRIKEIEVYYFG